MNNKILINKHLKTFQSNNLRQKMKVKFKDL